jgi:hypothetical protein
MFRPFAGKQKTDDRVVSPAGLRALIQPASLRCFNLIAPEIKFSFYLSLTQRILPNAKMASPFQEMTLK